MFAANVPKTMSYKATTTESILMGADEQNFALVSALQSYSLKEWQTYRSVMKIALAAWAGLFKFN